MPENHNRDRCFFEIAQRPDLLFYHKGYFSHSILAAMSEVVKLQLEVAGLSGPTRRKIFSSFVELSQNIVQYSSDSLAEQGGSESAIREGAMCISVEGDHHLMVCINPIATVAVDDLREKLEPLRTMSIEEI